MNKRMSALKFALENEQREREFYLAHARRTKNLAGKNMFKQIANEEKQHYEMLKKLFAAWETKSKWPESISLKAKKSSAGHILKSMADKKASRIKGNDDDLKAVRTAIDFEARGMALYSKLEAGSTDPKEKAFFNLLANMEREHFMSLRETEEFLADPTSWYQKMERTSLDGG